MTDFAGLIRCLNAAGVRYVVVGGFAAATRGSTRVTVDLDIVYARDADNLDGIVHALEPLSPYLRGAPRGLPFRLDVPTLQRGLNFTLTTSLGDLDLLGEVAGGGSYEALVGDTTTVRVFDADVRVVTLPQLIRLKRAAGRPRDLAVVAELEVLLEEQHGEP